MLMLLKFNCFHLLDVAGRWIQMVESSSTGYGMHYLSRLLKFCHRRNRKKQVLTVVGDLCSF